MNDYLERRLRFCSVLPSLPAIAIKVIELANDPATHMAQISEQVSFDPALSAKILRISASPLYHTRRKANNVRQAVSLLGTHAAIMIALSFSLSSVLRHQKKDGVVDSTLFWRRAILSALSCRALGERLGLENLDELFLAGLLQDVGILAFDIMLPDEYASVFASTTDHDALLLAERAAFGSGHDEVGNWLLKRWNLPDYLCMTCLASHTIPKHKESISIMAACVAVSGSIADNLIRPGDPASALRTGRLAHTLLALDGRGLADVMDVVADCLSAVEELFDITLLHQAEVEAIMAEAKNLLVLHDLSKVRELEEKSQRDALTGAHNRGYFDDALRREFDLACRHGWPLVIMLIDLDYFKTVNDTYGHPAGDAVLISAVRGMLGQLRQGDVFSRYGGEEFAVILPGTGLKPGISLAQRIIACMATMGHLQDNGKEIFVTASVGVVAHSDAGLFFASPADMIKAADEALYAAKTGGRNQVVEWHEIHSAARRAKQ